MHSQITLHGFLHSLLFPFILSEDRLRLRAELVGHQGLKFSPSFLSRLDVNIMSRPQTSDRGRGRSTVVFRSKLRAVLHRETTLGTVRRFRLKKKLNKQQNYAWA
jgi:hypothetical protein